MSEQDTRNTRKIINEIRASFGASPTTMTDDQIEAGREVYGAKLDYDVVVFDEVQDTREQLEADLNNLCLDCLGLGWNAANDLKKAIRRLLDRQAAITEREVKERVDFSLIAQTADALFPDYQERIAELTAEVKEQRQRANDAERGVLADEWYVARDRYEDDIAELTAERDELQAAIDAMNNGQFYAMYKAKCDECEQLKKVARTQAESFKKLECELAGKDG